MDYKLLLAFFFRCSFICYTCASVWVDDPFDYPTDYSDSTEEDTVTLGHYILTSPRVIDAGSTVYFTLTVTNLVHKGNVTLRLTREHSNALIAESKVSFQNNYNMWIEMTVPPMPSHITSAELHIIGSFNNDFNGFENFKTVEIRHRTILTFIQTDKPIYKPGQTVKFRVLPMDNKLLPLISNTIGDVWIEDPSNIRVAQWKQVHFKEGIQQFELPLSYEPPLGTWKIETLINEVKTTQVFKVEKYVLPKFEVTIKPPSVVMADAETIPIEICAKYTYGKFVEGNLKAKVTYKWIKKGRRKNDETRRIPSVEHQVQIFGCSMFTVNTDDLFIRTRHLNGEDLTVFAEVTENSTGIIRNATVDIKPVKEKIKLEFLEDSGFYKPLLSYHGRLRVTLPDGNPAASERIEICVSLYNPSCLTFISDKKGMIQFTIMPSSSREKISVEARSVNYNAPPSAKLWNGKLHRPFASMTLFPWYSPTDSFVDIEPTVEEFDCDKAQKVKVRYTATKGQTIKFYHQVLSKGRIVQQGSHQRTFYSNIEEQQYDFQEHDRIRNISARATTKKEVGEFILTFDTKATMSPISRLIIFYIRDNNEVVADSRMFRITKCLQNKVSFDFRHKQQYPNTEASMLLSASPSSICGINMVDKSIRLLEDDKTFNAKKLFQILESYDVGKPKDSSSPCMDDHALFWRQSRFRHPIQHKDFRADATTAFRDAGMVVISDLKVKTIKCPKRNYEPLMLVSGRLGPPVGFRSQNGPPGMVHLEESKNAFPMPVKEITDPPPASSEEIRSFFPETWLWELHPVGSSGETAIKRQLPHTITEWVGGAVCVHPETGLGISDTSSVTTFQPFFIDFQLPYSVVRGESLTLIVTVFNYLSECLPIKLSLEPSDDYQILSERRFQKVCICGGKSVGTRFPIRPTKLGKVNITAYAYSEEKDDEVCGNEVTARLNARDAITKGLLVEAEGFPKEEVFNYFICPESTNGSFATDAPLLLPDNVILDSARAYMSVTGDIMGPALNGLKELVRLPVGCGEQNMVLFAPNIFVMDYLTSTNKMTADIEEDCIKNMKIGYQRELHYRHNDGSYSAFGVGDKEGSLWLTAFVLKSFSQAKRFISIDEKDLDLSKTWITRKQFENGCFQPSGTVFHKEMKGGLKNDGKTLAPLTAYVLISLLESGIENHETVLTVKSALNCLETESNLDNYVLSLFAYATSLAKEHTKAAKYVEELDKRAVTKEDLKYWDSSSNSKSVSVEIAAYYILANLDIEGATAVTKVLPVIRWITRQRNSHGGFISTQDTVVALQALAKYASFVSQKPLDIALALETDDFTQGFKLDQSNKLVTQQVKITDLPSYVDIEAHGEGCALVQFSLRYNVQTISNSGELELDVNARRRGSSDCNLPSLNICMRFAEHNEKTNMAVLSAKMPSGYVADEWSLLLLKNDKDVQLMRYDIDENEVNLYFQEITNEIKCFDFHMKSEFEVEDTKPSIIRLYDYYQIERQVTKDYSIPSECNITALPDIFDVTSVDFQPETDSEEEELGISFADSEENKPQGRTRNSNEVPNPVTFDWNAAESNQQEQNDVGSPVIETVELKSNGLNSHLSAFTDVQQDLDFPSGIEGNMPVSVLPPGYENLNCPVCSDSFPQNFTAAYCDSAFALKVIKRDKSAKTIKILQDVSYYVNNPKTIKKFADLDYENECICPQITEKSTGLFIVGTPLDLWNTNEKKHRIQLTRSVYVISATSKQIHSFIAEAKISCVDDP